MTQGATRFNAPEALHWQSHPSFLGSHHVQPHQHQQGPHASDQPHPSTQGSTLFQTQASLPSPPSPSPPPPLLATPAFHPLPLTDPSPQPSSPQISSSLFPGLQPAPSTPSPMPHPPPPTLDSTPVLLHPTAASHQPSSQSMPSPSSSPALFPSDALLHKPAVPDQSPLPLTRTLGCVFCGGDHHYKKCPIKGTQCWYCSSTQHHRSNCPVLHTAKLENKSVRGLKRALIAIRKSGHSHGDLHDLQHVVVPGERPSATHQTESHTKPAAGAQKIAQSPAHHCKPDQALGHDLMHGNPEVHHTTPSPSHHDAAHNQGSDAARSTVHSSAHNLAASLPARTYQSDQHQGQAALSPRTSSPPSLASTPSHLEVSTKQDAIHDRGEWAGH